jgi:hypothetical protein
MWDLYLGWWTQEAIDKGYRAAVQSELEWLTLVEKGWITGADGNRQARLQRPLDYALVNR